MCLVSHISYNLEIYLDEHSIINRGSHIQMLLFKGVCRMQCVCVILKYFNRVVFLLRRSYIIHFEQCLLNSFPFIIIFVYFNIIQPEEKCFCEKTQVLCYALYLNLPFFLRLQEQYICPVLKNTKVNTQLAALRSSFYRNGFGK